MDKQLVRKPDPLVGLFKVYENRLYNDDETLYDVLDYSLVWHRNEDSYFNMEAQGMVMLYYRFSDGTVEWIKDDSLVYSSKNPTDLTTFRDEF